MAAEQAPPIASHASPSHSGRDPRAPNGHVMQVQPFFCTVFAAGHCVVDVMINLGALAEKRLHAASAPIVIDQYHSKGSVGLLPKVAYAECHILDVFCGCLHCQT